jgi:predicted PurR-regulated permease PerM
MEFSLDRFYQLNRRVLIWICLFGLVWLLRDYFSLIFLTFILAFVAVSLARLGQRYFHLKRALSVIIVYALFLLAIVSFIKFVTPAVGKETQTLLTSLPQIETRVLAIKGDFTRKYTSLNPLLRGYVQGLLDDDQLKRGGPTAPEPSIPTATPATSPASHRPAAPAPVSTASGSTSATATDGTASPALQAPEAAPLGEEPTRVDTSADDDKVARAFVAHVAAFAADRVPRLIGLLWGMLATLLLALLFSFLITLDITRLTVEIRNLSASRLHDFYEQTAQPVVRFAYVVGRAFQAQAVIACINTLLTFIGLLILGVPSVAMLSLVVFVCSFVPVLGVFLSTTPIVLVAVNAGGLSLAMGVIVLVTIVHVVEAYLLNPFIYGVHLKLNPVLVLIILFVGHRAFGVWGMLLAVPVTHYLLHDVFGVPVWQGEAKGGGPVDSSAVKPDGSATP